MSIGRSLVCRVSMRTESSRSAVLSVAFLILAGACAARRVTKEAPMTTTGSTTTLAAPVRKGHVVANGVRYYYEVHGRGGEPLLLLHGGMGSIEMFEPDLAKLSATREVIAVELHGHGRTQLGDRKISLVDQGNDMATICEALGYGKVDAMGYSLGGGVALRFAIQHPERVRRLVVVSAGFAQSGFYPEMLPMQAQLSAAMADAMKESPMYKSYAAIAPNPAEFPLLLDRMG